jgi:hypothetical protein
MANDHDLRMAETLFLVDPFLWRDSIPLDKISDKLPIEDLDLCLEIDLDEAMQKVG